MYSRTGQIWDTTHSEWIEDVPLQASLLFFSVLLDKVGLESFLIAISYFLTLNLSPGRPMEIQDRKKFCEILRKVQKFSLGVIRGISGRPKVNKLMQVLTVGCPRGTASKYKYISLYKVI